MELARATLLVRGEVVRLGPVGLGDLAEVSVEELGIELRSADSSLRDDAQILDVRPCVGGFAACSPRRRLTLVAEAGAGLGITSGDWSSAEPLTFDILASW